MEMIDVLNKLQEIADRSPEVAKAVENVEKTNPKEVEENAVESEAPTNKEPVKEYEDKIQEYKVGSYKFYWMLADYSIHDNGIGSTITHNMVNCNTFENKYISYAGYSGQMSKGELVEEYIIPEWDVEYFSWIFFDPDKTSQGAVLKKVCNTRY